MHTPPGISVPKREMTMEEFRSWFIKLDSDGDGRISWEELRKAIKDSGGWFPGWKSSWAIKSADSNGNGFIDKDEIDKVVKFAIKQFGIKIVQH